MSIKRKNLIEIIQVKIDENIELTLQSIAEFMYWKSVFPKAKLVNYSIQSE